MNKNIIKSFAVVMAFVLGLGVSIRNNPSPTKVEAAQYANNYAEYTYSGNYYSSISGSATEGLNGTLRTSLTTLIHPTQWYTYGSLGDNNLSTILQYADEDPTNSANMVYLYTRDSVKKNNSISGTGTWNREHVWPQSLSNKCWGTGAAGADLLHIRPTYESPNSKRGNHPYGDTNKTGALTHNGMIYGYLSGDLFEPLDCVKGDVARIIMYVWTAYKNHYSDLPAITSTFESYDTLLRWHTLDKPDVLEGNRNDFSESSKQKNRNPFVDHPEYAWKIFGDSASESVKNSCKAAYPDGGSTVPPGPSSSSSSAPSSSELPTSTSSTISSSEEASSSVETSVPSSSEEVVISNSSSEELSSQNGNGDKKKNAGCNGSLVIIPVAGLSALIGLVFVFSKKKK